MRRLIHIACLSLACASYGSSVPKAVLDLTGQPNDKCMVVDTIVQELFPEVTFVMVDTGCIYANRPEIDRFRLAYDSLGRGYKLFAFDSMQFNQLVQDHPIAINSDNVFAYGAFFLECTDIYTWNRFTYVRDVDEFLEYTRQLGKHWHDDLTSPLWAKLEQATRETCRRLTPDTIAYVPSERRFLLHYYVWFELSGDIVHYFLAIGQDGTCELLHKSTVASGVGRYWHYEQLE